MQMKTAMKLALATTHDRMAPCFAGVDLKIMDQAGTVEEAVTVSTHGWHPLSWGRELMRRDVSLVLCAGIDQGTWASIQGHGIEVVPGAMGDPDAALTAWRAGQLGPPALWPAYAGGMNGLSRRSGCGAGRRRRCRRGRQ